MKLRPPHPACLMFLLAWMAFAPLEGHADNRFIVRDQFGADALQSVCAFLGCSVQVGLDGAAGQLFLVTTSVAVDPNLYLALLRMVPGVLNAELDQLGKVSQSAAASGPPPALYDNALVNYFGASVIHGYVAQPAAQIVRLADAQNGFNAQGAGVVAVIDTGVDASQPVLQPVLVPGYDFTRNQGGGADEKADLAQSTAAVLDGQQPAFVNQSTAAVLDQSTAAYLNRPEYAAFGHGTMVAGVIHLVAPAASIMPLKAFKADGSGYLSDVLRAIHYATHNGATVINMSFSIAHDSRELSAAVTNAGRQGVVCVASAGNNGQNTLVYPAAYQSAVMGVASTSNFDQLSSFSNYGPNVAWVGAPGEGIITTYPWGAWAATWGTSFSAPFVSGTVALLSGLGGSVNESNAAQAVANAQAIAPGAGHGRLDIYQAISAWLASGNQ